MIEELTGLIGVFIPLSAIVLGTGIAFWSMYLEHQKKRLQYQERQLMIEKGLTPPPVLPDERKHVTPDDCLRRGTVLLSLGIGLAFASVVLANFASDEELAWIGGVAAAIVGSLGIGNLAYYRIARPKGADATAPATQVRS
jgi:hypothetical protein